MGDETALRILLVEDDPADAEVFRRYAAGSELYRMEVDHVRASKEALHRLSEHEYDLIFLDQRLGEATTGLDILKRIRAERPEPPAIVFTGTGDQELAVEMMKAGAVDYLIKETFNGEILERSIRHALAQHRSVIERRRAEEALRESERKYRHLFENLGDAAFLAEVETGRILETNKEAEVLLGRTREEIIGMHQSELHPVHEARKYRQKFADHVRKGRVVGHAGEVVRKDGSVVPVHISAAAMTIGGRRLILGLFRDITELNRLEAAAREVEKLRAIRDLSAGVAHNFNNLLSGMRGYAGFIRNALAELNAPLEDIEKLIECTERAARLSDHLHTWATPAVAPGQTVTLDSIVSGLVSRYRQVSPKNIELVTNIVAPNTCLKASLDSMLDALTSICDNAREAMPEGGTLSISADVVRGKDDEGEAESVAIVIADNGKGIPEEALPKIFDPFFSTKGTVGVGLSLALTRRVVEDHGGTIEVQSTPGQGATFRVLLPILQTDSEK